MRRAIFGWTQFRQPRIALLGTLCQLYIYYYLSGISYLGRRRMKTEMIATLEGSNYLNWVNYTWWTLGYMINLHGARKLISAKPLAKMMAVDEFLPVMYDRHPK